MTQDPLNVLLRLRHLGVEHARLAVIEAVQRVHAAAAAIEAIDRQAGIDRLAEAGGLQSDVYFGHVLGQGRALLKARRTQAQARLAQSEAFTAERRAVLAEARSEAETVAKLIADRKARSADLVERRTMHELDDVFRAQWLNRKLAEQTVEAPVMKEHPTN